MKQNKWKVSFLRSLTDENRNIIRNFKPYDKTFVNKSDRVMCFYGVEESYVPKGRPSYLINALLKHGFPTHLQYDKKGFVSWMQF